MVFVGVDMELMKERFSKLLLGEDMSGGGKGVSSALALSNAITNLAGNNDLNLSEIESRWLLVGRDSNNVRCWLRKTTCVRSVSFLSLLID